MRDHDHRGGGTVDEIKHEIQDESTRLFVECAGRLISEYETRPDHKRARNRDPLTFTTADLSGAAAGEMADVQQVELLERPAPDVPKSVAAGVHERQLHVLQGAQMGNESGVLKHESD
ncbi:hypothetical protein GCM10010921_00980 [Microbacterium album]|uniref:Uncharacterized protein n=1 Tax=Microbacterium album TaxID=2053191 RepID=A0A917IBM5_9MICO|nr:hypothetical protein GCM10010921_00980 [Microbacterium album]